MTWCHGGPTSSAQAGFDLTLQFFTSRGFAVACVDYAGSSGLRAGYRGALWGRWGVADSEDCLDAALHLAAQGDVDAGRMAIRGGSAGGMTALNALAAGEGFAACVSWYGVTDLMGSGGDHPRLRGALHRPADRAAARGAPAVRGALARAAVPPPCRARSCSSRGPRTPWCPPAQAEGMRAALRAVGTRCDLEFFEGEGHGFRRADTLIACLEAELAFYREAPPPLGSSAGGSVTAIPCVRGFCDPMPNDSTTTPPTLGRPPGRSSGSGCVDRVKRIPPGTGRRAALRGRARSSRSSPSTPRPTRSTRSGGGWRCCPSCSAPSASGVFAWAVRRARRRQPGDAADAAPAQACLGHPDRGGDLRVRRLARHSPRFRDPVAVRRSGRIPPAARGHRRRGRRAGPRPGPGPVPPVWCASPTR